MTLNRMLGIEIYLMHVGHFLLGIAAITILALNIPWWASLIPAPLVALAIVIWVYEARVVLPVANRLMRGGDAARQMKEDAPSPSPRTIHRP